MAYLNPPQLAKFSIATNAAINTLNSNVALIAAPGAGKQLRVSQITVMSRQTNTGVINCWFHGAGNTIFAVAGLKAAGDTVVLTFPEPGVLFGPFGGNNNALQFDNIATVATQTIEIAILFYTDTWT